MRLDEHVGPLSSPPTNSKTAVVFPEFGKSIAASKVLL